MRWRAWLQAYSLDYDEVSMPVSRRTSGNVVSGNNDRPVTFRPYEFHGVTLTERGMHGIGDCPFCSREGKFCVYADTGLYRCVVCGTGTERGGGNPLVFIRCLHTASVPPPNGPADMDGFRATVAADRRLAPPSVAAWGVGRSPVDGSWLVPGYRTDGQLDQLYKRTRILDKGEWVWRLLPTPGVWPQVGKQHALHLPASDFDPTCLDVYICEGPWDGMVFWEAARGSHIAPCQVIAVPGCNVWRDEWTEFCRGKRVTILFDSDHPLTVGSRTLRAGLDGTVRIAKRLSSIAASVRWLRWGQEGYDPNLPSGYDIRDYLTSNVAVTDRRAALIGLFSKIEDVPHEWCVPAPPNIKDGGNPDIEPLPCEDLKSCIAAWEEAMYWRSDLTDVMTVMIAVAASTVQAGDDQLFLQVVADPGSAKTRMCKGLLVSKKCKLVLHLKSFHSGWKGKDGKECSFVDRINGLCLVTPEADAMYTGLSSQQIDSQARQIFDGETGNTYANTHEDKHWKGLRTPWIQAGTPALMDKDQSRLGDRFIRIRIDEPPQETKRAIMLRALRNAGDAVKETSNGTESSIVSPKLRVAYGRTGGFVDWLRANIDDKIADVNRSEEADLKLLDMAELVADMRARPNMDPKKHEVHHTKELGTRLAGQFCRLAMCLAVVMNKREVDSDILRIIRKVALDTAHGHSLNIVRWLCSPNVKANGRSHQDCGGLSAEHLGNWLEMSPERLYNYLNFLRKIGVVQLNQVAQTSGYYMLTERVFDLYLRVMEG